MEPLINTLYERIASLRGTRSLACRVDESWLLRSLRVTHHLVRRINQHFPIYIYRTQPRHWVPEDETIPFSISH